VKSSDYQFGNIHKGITSNPYKNASISEFNPAKPWAAYADVTMEPFLSISELDAEYDSWLESGNPFLHDKTACSSGQIPKGPPLLTNRYTNLDSSDQTAKSPSLQLLPTLTANQSFSQSVANIIKSDDKLFFIRHSPPSQSR
jgi:hypothetical protein